ncbi:glycosyltransferase [Aeromonas enteropelogenes]|uniref:glycosyltransferase n=1 Tax=Aeromonas enteropelogenes TaxID=29489 RepID=UPI0009ED5E64|nr:glycosyltransferase [Aeromonas enteropelogenes]
MKKNVCLIYAWENFRLNYFEKDVGLFPKFFAKSSGQDLDNIIFDSIGCTNEANKGSNKFYNSRNYLSFIKDCVVNNFFSLRNIKYFILFHISLRTCLLSIILKSINPSSIIIVKADLSVSNVIEFSRLRKSNFIKYYLISILNRTIDAFCIETTQSINLLLSDHKHLVNKDRIYHVPNGVIEKNIFSKKIRKKHENSISIITRDDSPLKGVDRIVPLLRLLDKSLSECSSTAVIRIVGPLSSGTRGKILSSVEKLSTLDVHLLGSLSRDETLAVLAQSQLFVNLSIEESYCFALVEAALANCYIITTPVGVSTDLSGHYKYINILEYEANSFVKCIQNNINNPSDNISLNELSDKKVYDWEQIIDRFYINFMRKKK